MESREKEITELLLLSAKTEKPAKYKDLKKYIGTNYDFTGLSVPTQRALFKKGFSFSGLPLAKQLEIWDRLWKTSSQYDIMTFALMFVNKHLKAFEPVEIWNITREWVSKVDNWAHSDQLSTIYADLLEIEADLIYAQYGIWNKSVNPWERRQSLVGLLNYSKLRKKVLQFEKLSSMALVLLKDDDYFVQKGVGWTLREMGNVYPEETFALLTGIIAIIHPTAFTAAIEKLTITNKEQLKELRKAARKKLPA